MLNIQITNENYEFYDDVYSYGCDMLFSKNAEEKETGSYIFHTSIIEAKLQNYSDETLVKAIGKALDDYDKELEVEEEEPDCCWEAYTYERECYPHL